MVLYCLLPQIHSTDKPEELQKKHPVRSPTFSKLPPPYFIFSLNADIAVRKMVRLETGVSSYYKCIRFFTDAIISYSMQKSIVGILNIYTLFPVFLYIFYIFPDYFRLYFNDLIFITDIFLYCLIYFLRLY